MATDRIVDAQEALGNRTTAAALLGGDIKSGVVTTEKTASDTDTSVLRVFTNVPVESVINTLRLMNDALAGATSVSMGIYQINGGAVLDSALFASAVDIHSASTHSSPVDMLQSVDLANLGLSIKALYDAAHASTPLTVRTVDICLTGTTFGTAAGTITVEASARVQ